MKKENFEKLISDITSDNIVVDEVESNLRPSQVNRNLFKKALLKYINLFNNTDGSRKFVTLLISNFLVEENSIDVVNLFTEEELQNQKDKCSVLNIKLASAAKIKEASKRSDKKYSIELKKKSYAFFSTLEKDNINRKYLCYEALCALNVFYQNLIKNRYYKNFFCPDKRQKTTLGDLVNSDTIKEKLNLK